MSKEKETSEKRSIIEILGNIDRRYIYICLIICVVVTLLNPIGLPVPISAKTKGFFKIIQSLDSGTVLVANDMTASGIAEYGPLAIATLQHLFNRPVKIIIVSFFEDGPMLLETRVIPKIDTGGKKYGVDFVNLGFVAGWETGMASFAKDIATTTPNDFFGTPIGNLPVLKGVNSAADFRLMLVIADVRYHIRQFYVPYHLPILNACMSVDGPGFEPYLNAGQLVGLLVGVRGAAEYELLTGNLGSGVSSMDAISVSHLLFIGFVILGNLIYIKRKVT